MASGDPIAELLGVFFPTTDFPTPDATAARVEVWDFDDGTTETMFFLFRMTSAYDGSGDVDVEWPWKFTTFVGSQTCDWEVAIARARSDTDSIESLSFSTAQTGVFAEASATGETIYSSLTFTQSQFDSVAVDDYFVASFKRDASGGTASPGDAELLAPTIRAA